MRRTWAAAGRPLAGSEPVFGFSDAPVRGRQLQLPHWLILPVFVVGAATSVFPLIRWRFSLRTLLIATTLVAVVLGLVVVFR
jgi:hypothetical protein